MRDPADLTDLARSPDPVASLVARFALARSESRGVHYRIDAPTATWPSRGTSSFGRARADTGALELTTHVTIPAPAPRKIYPPDPTAVARVVAGALAETCPGAIPPVKGSSGRTQRARCRCCRRSRRRLRAADRGRRLRRAGLAGRRDRHLRGRRPHRHRPRRARSHLRPDSRDSRRRANRPEPARPAQRDRHAGGAVRRRVGRTGAVLLDTRKTTAGCGSSRIRGSLRRCLQPSPQPGRGAPGQGQPLRLAGGVAAAVARLQEAHSRLRLEVEAETLDDVRAALKAGSTASCSTT